MTGSTIPFGAQFSPNQVDLPALLVMIHKYSGDRKRLTQAILEKFFTSHTEGQRWKLADNTVLALKAYGLLHSDYATPTPLANKLLKFVGSPDNLYIEFARHVLIDLRGLALVETIEMMQSAGEKITLRTLRKKLRQRGINVPRGAVHISSMRLWLAKAGVFGEATKGGGGIYNVNKERLEEILGVGQDVIDTLRDMSRAQRAFLRTLAHISDRESLAANKVADMAGDLYGIEYDYKSLPRTVLFPLQNAGYITAEKTTSGRGAKPYRIRKTDKFHKEIQEPILSLAAEMAGLTPRSLMEKPMERILDDLRSSDQNTKGKALELLVIRLGYLLGLEFKGWRTRSTDTGGAEVDVILEGTRLLFSRWQIQAKNTKTVRLGDVAKEVGLALTFIYSNVVMIVTTGDFTRDAYRYSRHVMKTSNLNVILLNGSDLRLISEEPNLIVKLLSKKAREAMKVKIRDDYFV